MVNAVVVMDTARTMSINLYPHQKIAIEKLKSGSILCGGVGSGKSRTSIAYYFVKECNGNINVPNDKLTMNNPKDLYIITTARKRDTYEWEQECIPFNLTKDRSTSICNVKVTVDSWNNINKYANVKNSFFIFDEQRVVGSGSWVKSFIEISKKNRWILLSATPGDCWMDYIPVFIANGFYKNRTQFINRHVVYNRFLKYPKVERYLDCKILEKYRQDITVIMKYSKPTTPHNINIIVNFDKEKLNTIFKDRWNIFENKPIKDSSQLCYTMRKVVNSDPSRCEAIKNLLSKHDKIIVFYNFNYELEILRDFCKKNNINYSEWNGHKHEPIQKTDRWLYLVQYTSGAEGWNCIETNAIAFYSQNYSYKIMTQSAGRIDRLNTPFADLYYYHLRSTSIIDLAILKSLKNKETFNEQKFINNTLA